MTKRALFFREKKRRASETAASRGKMFLSFFFVEIFSCIVNTRNPQIEDAEEREVKTKN